MTAAEFIRSAVRRRIVIFFNRHSSKRSFLLSLQTNKLKKKQINKLTNNDKNNTLSKKNRAGTL